MNNNNLSSCMVSGASVDDSFVDATKASTSTSSIDWSISTDLATVTVSNYNNCSNTIATTTSPYITGGTIGYYNAYDSISITDNLQTLISFLKEDEIDELLEKFIQRAIDKKDEIKKILSSIVAKRHFSEDFLLKYFDYLTIQTIREQHNADISSQNYERLALLIASHD